MRLLENLVSDLIRDSTGLNPRRLVRRIGGGKILLAGGAALAGAFLADKAQSKSQGASRSQVATSPSTLPAGAPGLPPLPPVPTSLPPLPPLPTTASLEDEQEISPESIAPDLEYAVIRAMVAAALADGHLAEEERSKILNRVDSSDLPEERVRQIHEDLVLPPTPSDLAALVSEPAEREVVYTFAALLCHQDGTLHPLEEEWLQRLAVALELSQERRDDLLREAESLAGARPADPTPAP